MAHILQVHGSSLESGKPSTAFPLDPLQNGSYKDNDGQLRPTTTDVLPAPVAIIKMARCQCKGECSSQRSSCRAKNLQCTDLCM
ncbi:hypothetical protein Hamer_G025595 [Homarus americanus]|uniref:Uncharacterized protein n=1 Tax=Homarus americanus TaxID=6706 RepID=A0A8J5K6B2_HOMAM|nr:hypothetical protein Hamer_G025595 [Homarus americanus]